VERDQDKHYTLLSILAQKYFSISGTSVSSEHLFSKVGELVSEKQTKYGESNSKT